MKIIVQIACERAMHVSTNAKKKKAKENHRIYSTMTTLLTRADRHVDLFGSCDIECLIYHFS